MGTFLTIGLVLSIFFTLGCMAGYFYHGTLEEWFGDED